MSSKSFLDNESHQDFTEFLNEYTLQTYSPNHEPEMQYEDGEMEAEWLVASGFPQLTKPFEQGLEVQTSDLEPILASLPESHADAVMQRVRALNYTVRGRTKSRQRRKPDIREVFSIKSDFDQSSTGTRSRSATPDSLDSMPVDEAWDTTIIPNFVSIFDNGPDVSNDNNDPHYNLQHDRNTVNSEILKQKLIRTPSEPIKAYTDIFRGSHVRCDLPMYSAEGIELVGFSRIGTIHLSRNRSGSDPSCSVRRSRGNAIQHDSDQNKSSSVSSDDNLMNRILTSQSIKLESTPHKIIKNMQEECPPLNLHSLPSVRDSISFESMCRETSSQYRLDTVDGSEPWMESGTDIDSISETELKQLQPIFWLELAAIFDRNHVTLDKRKPYKRRRKEEGNLFGVSLNALIRRDQQITGTDSSLVPLFLEGMLAELIKRGLREEGILRVGGHKQKTELLYYDLETCFYQTPNKFPKYLSSANVHDLSALLKRWIRELPQPLLTNELIQLFYQCHALHSTDQSKAFIIICQMLPHENRNTLRTLLRFLNYVIDKCEFNKMNLHNVATIIAPSFFPPRYVHPINKHSIEEQVKMAAQCCRITNVLILLGESLFHVPNNLIEQSKANKTGKRSELQRRAKSTTSLKPETDSRHLLNNRLDHQNIADKNCNNSLRKNADSYDTHHIDIKHIDNKMNNNIVNKSYMSKTLNRQQSINPSHVHRLII